MKKSKFVAIRNQLGDSTLELYFLDIIQDQYDWWTGMEISKVQQIIDQVNANQPSKIICFIDSEGGDAQTGMSIYNFLKLNQAKVEVRIIGLAGSIASVIAMAASKGRLFIAKNAFMMIHKAEGMAWGSSDELRQAADLVDLYTSQIVDIYSQRTGKTVEEINALIANGDYWMAGADAVTQGFADDTFNDDAITLPNLNIAARLNRDVYKNMPAQVRALLTTETPPQEEGDLETINQLFMKLGDKIKNLFKNHKPTNAAAPMTSEEIGTIMQPALDEFETEVGNQINQAVESDPVIEKITNKVQAKLPPAPAPAPAPDINAAITAMVEADGDNPLKTFVAGQVAAATKTLTEENTAIKNQLTQVLGKDGGSNGGGNNGGTGGYQPRGKIK